MHPRISRREPSGTLAGYGASDRNRARIGAGRAAGGKPRDCSLETRLGYTDGYALRADPGPKLLYVLPDLEIHFATDLLNSADRACLELMAVSQNDGGWVIDAERILSHVEAGGALAELQQFLEANAVDGHPESVRDWPRACWPAERSLRHHRGTEAQRNPLCLCVSVVELLLQRIRRRRRIEQCNLAGAVGLGDHEHRPITQLDE